MTGQVMVVLGPPCAGKSSYVRKTARSGDVIVDYDVLATAFGSPTPHDAPEAIAAVTSAPSRSRERFAPYRPGTRTPWNGCRPRVADRTRRAR